KGEEGAAEAALEGRGTTEERLTRQWRRLRWNSSHQRRLSSPPASLLPEIHAAAVTTASSSRPRPWGACDAHQRTSRISNARPPDHRCARPSTWCRSPSDRAPGG